MIDKAVERMNADQIAEFLSLTDCRNPDDPTYLGKTEKKHIRFLQGDQLNMAVCFWYLVKREFSSVRYMCDWGYLQYRSHVKWCSK